MAVKHLSAPAVNLNICKQFWSKVQAGEPDDCWPWLASRVSKGYGRFYIACGHHKCIGYRAHALARFLSTGEWPSGLSTLHTCDNPPCCNPRHLFLGTHTDNVSDMMQKGRGAKGERMGNAVLTAEIVRAARSACSPGGMSVREFARLSGVLPTTLIKAVRRHTWRHID